MSDGTALIYRYDGSFDGLMSAVYEAFSDKKMPERIIPQGDGQTFLFDEKEIFSDSAVSQKMQDYIKTKISPFALDNVRKCYFSNAEEKEMLILKYILLGIKHGKKVDTMLADDVVGRMFFVVKNFSNEAHFYREFLRFSENEGVLASVIEPKNFVLPYIVYHYEQRIGNLDFLIYDKTHKAVLVHKNHRSEIAFVEGFELPPPDEKERFYRELWKGYYNIIGIKERYNEKLRMNLMPKRYWSCLTEFEDMYDNKTQSIAENNNKNRLIG